MKGKKDSERVSESERERLLNCIKEFTIITALLREREKGRETEREKEIEKDREKDRERERER